MARKFVAHLGFLVFVNLLIKPFWIFGIDRVVQNQVGAAEYGTYFSLYNFSVLLYVLLDFGISNFNNRSVSFNQKSLMENLGSLFLLKLILSGIYLSVTLFSAFTVGFSSLQLQWLFVLCMGQVFLSFLLFFRSGMAGLQAFREDAILSVSDKVLMILLVGSLLLFLADGFQIQYFVYAQALSWGTTALFAFAWLLYKAGNIEWNWNSKSIFPLLQATVPFAFIGLLMSIYSRIDGVMIERMMGTEGAQEAGIYAASFRLLDAVNMFAYLFASILLPMFSNMLSKKESVIGLLGFSTRILTAIAFMLCIGSFFFGRDFMSLLYPAATVYYYEILIVLISSFFGTAMVYVFGTLLLAANKLKWINIIVLAGMLLNIVLNIYLIPIYGAFGAAVATLFTQLLVGGSQVVMIFYHFKIAVRWQYFLQTVAFSGLLALVSTQIIELDFHWVFRFGIWVLIALLLALVSGFLPGKDKWIFYLKEKR